MRSRQEIEDILSMEIESARERSKAAGKRLREITSEIPSSLPAPDGALHIQMAGAEYRSGLESLRKALTRFNDYHAHGIVPDDLLN